MPWKGEKDPYRIWLSEIILQQTRVEQGLPYYEKFLAAFPTVKALAGAPEQVVLKLWEGLGYYSRARNLLRCAQVVCNKYHGQFPQTLPELLELPGVGPYTAAAIASFAFHKPVAAIDANVERILSRIWGVEIPMQTPGGKKEIARLATRLLDPIHPGEFNQAMMDFGALQCLPRNPLCKQCPFQTCCSAFLTQRTADLPTKIKKPAKRLRFFHYLVIRSGTAEAYVRQRSSGDIWASLWEFPLIEYTSLELSLPELIVQSPLLQDLPYAQLIENSRTYRQTLTHQQIAARFWIFHITPDTAPLPEAKGWQRIPWNALNTTALPGIIRLYLEDQDLLLAL